MSPAVFLDRDGVLIDDLDLICRVDHVRILAGVPGALGKLKMAGFKLVVVTNQPVIARGMATEEHIRSLNEHVQRLLMDAGGPKLDGWYVCPHHPEATLTAYRVACECRKPQPGLLLQGARELSLDLKRSFMIGDRLTDIIAGAKAGTRTILVKTGKHLAPLIKSSTPIDSSIEPDHVSEDLNEAAEWILMQQCDREIH